MNTPISATIFVGIDCAAETFCAALWEPSTTTRQAINDVANSPDGFQEFVAWLWQHHGTVETTLICIENTGVYSEHLLYWLDHAGLHLWLESPQKIKRAFRLPQKSDPTDARQIAEYCYRYVDECTLWQPHLQIVEQVKVLLAAREQLQAQHVANRNVLTALRRKYIQTPGANHVIETLISQLAEHLKQIDHQIKELITNNSQLGPTVALLMSIPGVGLLMASNLLVLTRGFTDIPEANHLASYLGVCPHEYSSGTSVYKRPRSSGFGLARMRKLLYLASMSLKTHQKEFNDYYVRKCAEGKSPRLVLNNISNKLLRIICAVLQSGTPYVKNYRSLHPRFVTLDS